MSNRITNSITSRRARESLVRLLFPVPTDGPLPDHGKRYSYTRLKAAYLERVHAMHPDKLSHGKQGRGKNSEEEKVAHLEFIELKAVWEDYDRIMKQHKISKHLEEAADANANMDDEGSFTMFGVGCSFADSPTERDYRNEIMEQACRGWIPSGSLSTGEGSCLPSNGENAAEINRGNVTRPASTREAETKLSDDDMFVSSCNEKMTAMKREDARHKCLVQDAHKLRWK